ncbi:MHYT domain-containing protein [Nocardia sp. NPDC127579]|uniref:MHYT domain-containing protein n=1 Tax=Nocardia sp. NPDC127579 TaxID=3345402 RepID=UPI003642C3AA
MLDISHFSYGWITPLMAYLMSILGSLLGLQCAVRARQEGQIRPKWLVAAAVSIGGAGIWVMHFIAMLGFSIDGAQIRYNVGLTLLSAVTAIAVVGIGLFTVIRPQPTLPALLAGGAITGLGVAAMHYTGMYAMKSDAQLSYDLPLVALSVLIAVVAATVALWFALRVNGIGATIAAAAIMGVAISGMHYTGMSALRAHHTGHAATPSGTDPAQLLAPLLLGISVATMLLLIGVTLTAVEDKIVDLPRLRGLRRGTEAAAESNPERPQPDSSSLGARWSTRADDSRLRSPLASTDLGSRRAAPTPPESAATGTSARWAVPAPHESADAGNSARWAAPTPHESAATTTGAHRPPTETGWTPPEPGARPRSPLLPLTGSHARQALARADRRRLLTREARANEEPQQD